MKNHIPQSQTIDIINSDIPTRAVDITDHEKPTVVTTPKGVLTALAAFLIWGFSPCILSYSKIIMRLKSLGIELFGRLSRFY
jgi:chloramphenicol-sensitive protein RarD